MRTLVVVLRLAVACGPMSEAPPEPSPEPAGSLTLVGEWRWIRSCDAVVQAFRDAGLVGLTRVWLVETRYFSREDLIDRGRPCAGAEENWYVLTFDVDVPERCDEPCRDGYAWGVATFAAATLRRAA
jgi:hypothetical protein